MLVTPKKLRQWLNHSSSFLSLNIATGHTIRFAPGDITLGRTVPSIVPFRWLPGKSGLGGGVGLSACSPPPYLPHRPHSKRARWQWAAITTPAPRSAFAAARKIPLSVQKTALNTNTQHLELPGIQTGWRVRVWTVHKVNVTQHKA